MAQDIEMEDGYETDYPDPYANNPTPYPALSQRPESPSSRPDTANGDFHTYSVAALTPWTNTAPSYSTLAEYFNIGNIARYQSTEPDAAENGAEQDEGETRSQSNPDGIDDHYGSPPPTDSALPGYHALPDIDIRYPVPSLEPVVASSQNPAQENPSESGRARGRGSRGPHRAKRGRGSWKKVLEKTQAADFFKTPRLPRDPTAKRRGRKKGPSIPRRIDPGATYKEAAARASNAFIAGNLDEALEHVFAAIRANPEVYHGHVLFSEILEQQGRPRDALFAITNGAAVKRDPQVWMQIAERYLAFEGDDQDPEDIPSALKCYSEACKLDKTNCEIREAKLSLLLEIEDWIAARLECKGLVRLRPAELDYVRQYVSLCNMTGRADDRERAIIAYENAFKLMSDQTTFENLDELWDHLNVYLDLLYRAHRAQNGVTQSKRMARWFLGRKADAFWDSWDIDDREFDTDDARRRQVWQYEQMTTISRDPQKYGLGLPLDIRVKMGFFRAQMGYIYQPEARRHLEHLQRLSDQVENYADMFCEAGHCMRQCGFPAVAIQFYEPLKSYPDLVDHEFWMGLGKCYQLGGRNEEAEECFLEVIKLSENHVDAHMALVKLYHSMDEKVKAHSMADAVTRLGHKNLLLMENLKIPKPAKSTPKRNDNNGIQPPQTGSGSVPKAPKQSKSTRPPKKPRANVAIRAAETPVRQVSEDAPDGGLDPDMEDPDTEYTEPGSAPSTGSPLKRYANQTRWIEEQGARVQMNYVKLQDLWAAFEAREDDEMIQQWMYHANELAKDFRSVKEFFPLRDRERYFTGLKIGPRNKQRKTLIEMAALRNSMQNNADNEDDLAVMRALDASTPQEFHGIAFAEWHRILSTLAMAHADRVDQENCYDILQNVLLKANVFLHDQELKNTTLALCLCCALIFNDSKFAADTVQDYDFPGVHQAAKATHLIAASGRLSHGTAFSNHKHTYQWVERTVKEQDYLCMSPEERAKVNWGPDSERLNSLASQNESELNPALLMTYAHLLAHRQMNTNLALTYLFRALAIQPDDPLINLSIGITYLNASIHADAIKRQHDMVQGQAFLYHSYDLRTANGTASDLQEAEFNLGRAWQVVGWGHLALAAFERVLELSESVQQEGREDFAPEAALALRGMFVQAGNWEAAREVSERWLVI